MCLRQLPRLYCQVLQNVCHLFMFSGKSNVLRVILLRKIYICIKSTLNYYYIGLPNRFYTFFIFIFIIRSMWIPSCQSINAIENRIHFAGVIVSEMLYFETVDKGEYLQNHLIWYAYITIIIRFNLYYSWRSITLSILTRRVI